MTKKKLLGIILCAMLVLLCAVPAMAADNEPSELDTTVGLDLTQKIEGETVYAADGGSITVTKDDPTSLAQLYAMDGTELRLANIALTESNGDLAKDGYCYNSNTKVITLENVLVSAIDQLPSGDITIKIKGTVVF